MNQPGSSQVVASAVRWGSIAVISALLVVGWGYADGDSSRMIVKNVLVAVTPILGGAFGFGFYDGRRAVSLSRGKPSLRPYDVAYYLDKKIEPTIIAEPPKPKGNAPRMDRTRY